MKRKHATEYKIHWFTVIEIEKKMKKTYVKNKHDRQGHKRQLSLNTTKERKKNFTRRKAKSDLFGDKLCITNNQVVCLDAPQILLEEYHLKNVCVTHGYMFPEYFTKIDISCGAYGLKISKCFDLIPQTHQQLFKRFFYASGMITLSKDPLSSLILVRLLRLDRGFLMSYFLIIDKKDFRNSTTICKTFDEIKSVKLRVYTESNYFRVFSPDNNDPEEGITKYDLVYLILRLLEAQQSEFEPLLVSKDFPCIIEYFSLNQEVDYSRTTKTTE